MMSDTSILAAWHAETLTRVAARREAADLHRKAGDTNRAEMAEDEAALMLRRANALLPVLRERGAFVHDDEDQLVLFQLPRKEMAA